MSKHRVIPVFGLSGDTTRVELEGASIRDLNLHKPFPIEDGALVAEFTMENARTTPSVTIGVEVEVRFEADPPGYGEEITPFLMDAMNHVRGILEHFQTVIGT